MSSSLYYLLATVNYEQRDRIFSRAFFRNKKNLVKDSVEQSSWNVLSFIKKLKISLLYDIIKLLQIIPSISKIDFFLLQFACAYKSS